MLSYNRKLKRKIKEKKILGVMYIGDMQHASLQVISCNRQKDYTYFNIYDCADLTLMHEI